MTYLVVVAHPDDEVLGAGGVIYKWSQVSEVYVCILSAQVNVRTFRPNDEELNCDIKESTEVLGVKKVFSGNFPNIKLNTIPHLELVQFIEKVILETTPDVVITHHPSDLNNDHLHTSLACQEAVRLFQRREGISALKELMFMEVPSATDWALNSSAKMFSPNVFVEIGEIGVTKKINALSLYRGVMRDYPHPRSPEVLKGLAAYRGGQAGLNYAEAFECVFRRIK